MRWATRRALSPRMWIKRLLPRSLLGRSLLMILLPLVLLQVVALRIFYGTHLDVLSRRMASSIAGEVGYTIELLDRFPDPADRDWILSGAAGQFDLTMQLEPGLTLPSLGRVNVLGPFDDDLASAIEEKIHRPYMMDWDWAGDPRAVLIRVQLADGVLDIEAPRKRLYVSTIFFFVFWLLGTSAVVFAIAAAFMRNQVRAIRRLAGAAEDFGIGRDVGPIRPEGATEVRQAATAFNRMRERVLRILAQRTEMLAGVSHDLRTPLTRLRLALAVMPRHDDSDEAEINAMETDIDEMERMISGYLAFARGEGSEQAQSTDLGAMLADIANRARRAGAQIACEPPADLTLKLRSDAIRRALTNLVDNARRHASHVSLGAQRTASAVFVTIDDDGPGIPPDQREAVFRAFERGASGGTGLGLTIARDIVRAHGGDIALEQSPHGGLRARVRLPL